MQALNSRYKRIFNANGEVIIRSHEFKEDVNKPFIPMLSVNIETGETMIDTRQQAYWKK